MSYRFTFGKYKNQTLDNVIKKDVNYVYWCTANVSWFNLPEGVKLPPKKVKRRIIWIEDDPYWDDYDDIYGWGGQDWW